ncbi:glycoside hydrolase family 17 protein [Riemerella anatipestifer]|uniref:Endo-1,3-beta-glucanase btgC n=2 Tax=Riemerella anatipestifer TaxID=34085 RepID=A0A1S7DPP5_RIEAN|nr:glycosyl hydrolase family 17 [Riemerella anatipestifer]AQY21097.1 hypothetical protein AB406_0132 [Riemerella anatipestifer]MCO4304654.1 glycosyl hydrolase family 17 [Riemerella anatipestifer]MCO7353513.1 glycosyl hydrolase family 17 [Riemerella anatipestifer]MCQ4040002.1 glycosyl hydrolase family 17 [Riemerella anatipestifer]MCT6761629.1 glycosyl hydrolase family 17 [Riemerella anatipestifer]
MEKSRKNITAAEILGNPNYLAMSYGGYRSSSREITPTVEQVKQDMKILSAMGVKIIRSYNVHLPEIHHILTAIEELNKENPDFEMYLMLGVWIDCKNAWTELPPNHYEESERNEIEVKQAVALAKKYPEIIKIIAVGNEAMVKWATAYYVQPNVILRWVNYFQELKEKGELSKDLWITSSDNFASWGGGETEYHTPELEKLIKAVDYVSIHTYPMHDTHYNPVFWGVPKYETHFSKEEQIRLAMKRVLEYAQYQYLSVEKYMQKLGVEKPIHIGETAWASTSNEFYGNSGTKATDEYKAGLYYQLMRDWTNQNNITCFYFEAFDEPWKDAKNPEGSENHFGLFTVDGKAKFGIWDLVDSGRFNHLNRNGNKIEKTYSGSLENLMKGVEVPHIK